MTKTILVTGSTAGIGLATAEELVAQGHRVLLHGRSASKVAAAKERLAKLAGGAVEGYVADLSRMGEVQALGAAIAGEHGSLDVLINNAGVLKAAEPMTADGLDVRFAVNTLAPVVLTRALMPLLGPGSRVINLSSAAQAPVNLAALAGRIQLETMAAYSQSKLALTAWSRVLAGEVGPDGPVVVAVNPGSMLGTEMVKQGFGVPGRSIDIGASILVRAALSHEFAGASGRYFDNDSGRFAAPHPDALDATAAAKIMQAIEALLA